MYDTFNHDLNRIYARGEVAERPDVARGRSWSRLIEVLDRRALEVAVEASVAEGGRIPAAPGPLPGDGRR